MNWEYYEKKFGNQFLDEIIGWIQTELYPTDVFDENALGDWARDNGYIKNEDIDDNS